MHVFRKYLNILFCSLINHSNFFSDLIVLISLVIFKVEKVTSAIKTSVMSLIRTSQSKK